MMILKWMKQKPTKNKEAASKPTVICNWVVLLSATQVY